MYKAYSWISEISEYGTYSHAQTITVQVILIILSVLFFIIFITYVKRYILYKISIELRNEVIGKIFSMNLKSFKSYDKSLYSSMILNDIDIIESEYFSNLVEIIGDLIQLIVMMVVISFVGIKYVMVILIFSALSIAQPFILRKKLIKKNIEVSKQNEIYTKNIKSIVNTYELYKTNNKQFINDKKFTENAKDLEKVKFSQKTLTVINSVLLIFSIYIVKFGIQLFLTYNTITGIITVATATALFGLANNVSNPIASILKNMSNIQSTKGMREKIKSFVSKDFDIDQKNTLNTNFSQKISFNNVSFSYDENLIIKDFSFDFRKGKKYALVGGSGSGKSTLLKLMMRHLNEYSGKISIDSFEYRQISDKALWSKIAYIQQAPFILNGTLNDNITLFSKLSDQDKIQSIILKSDLQNLVSSLDDGVNTIITEGGKNLSGGEKQRIALARALFADRDILALDESFSALDNITATKVEEFILSLDKTIISITHRLDDTLCKYDEVLVLENGILVEHGNFEFLMKKSNSALSKLIRDEIGGNDNE